MDTAQLIDQVATPIGVAFVILFVLRRKRPNAERLSWTMSLVGAVLGGLVFFALKRVI